MKFWIFSIGNDFLSISRSYPILKNLVEEEKWKNNIKISEKLNFEFFELELNSEQNSEFYQVINN